MIAYFLLVALTFALFGWPWAIAAAVLLAIF